MVRPNSTSNSTSSGDGGSGEDSTELVMPQEYHVSRSMISLYMSS